VWIQLVQERVQCRSLVNTIMHLRVSYVKGREFLDKLNDCQFLKKDSAQWNYLILLSYFDTDAKGPFI
jgi:hypothetical protein